MDELTRQDELRTVLTEYAAGAVARALLRAWPADQEEVDQVEGEPADE